MNLFTELKRRNVFRVAIAYGVVAWFLLQAADIQLRRAGLGVQDRHRPAGAGLFAGAVFVLGL